MYTGAGEHTLLVYLLSTLFLPSITYFFQVLQQQQTNNHTSFTYLSSDVKSKGPLTVSLAIMCPSITITTNTSTDVGIPIAIALAVVLFVASIAYGIRQVSHTPIHTYTHHVHHTHAHSHTHNPLIDVITQLNPFQWPFIDSM